MARRTAHEWDQQLSPAAMLVDLAGLALLAGAPASLAVWMLWGTSARAWVWLGGLAGMALLGLLSGLAWFWWADRQFWRATRAAGKTHVDAPVARAMLYDQSSLLED